MDFETYDELKMTPEQIKSAKAVYRAIRKANKLGVSFWDDYGTLSCYNDNKIARLNMEGNGINIRHHDITYSEMLPKFYAGNSDDDIWAEPN